MNLYVTGTLWIRALNFRPRVGYWIIGLAILYAVVLLVLIASAFTRAKAIEGDQEQIVLGFSSGESGDLDRRLGEVDYSVRKIEIWLKPVTFAWRSLDFIPWSQNQREAVELTFDRVSLNLVLASELGNVANGALESFRRIRDRGTSPDSLSFDGELELAAVRISETLSDVEQTRLEIDSIKGEIDLRKPIGPIKAVNRVSLSQEQALLNAAEFAYNVRSVLTENIELIRLARQIGDLGNFSDGDRIDISSISTLIAVGAEQARAATRYTEASLEFLSSYGSTSAAESLETLNEVDSALAGIFSSLQTIIFSLETSMDQIGSVNGPLLENNTVVLKALDVLVVNQQQLSQAVIELEQSAHVLERVVNSEEIAFPDSMKDLTTKLQTFTDLAEFLESGPQILRGMLGEQQPVTHLILGQSTNEMRAIGGFTSSLWLAKFDHGMLVDTEYRNMAAYEDLNELSLYPNAPSDLNTFMNSGKLFMRDVGWSPNFPSVAEAALENAKITEALADDELPDYVIAVTPTFFRDLATAVGGIEVDGELIKGDAIIDLLERETDIQGTSYLRQIFELLIGAINGNSVANDPTQFMRMMLRSLQQKDLMIYSRNQEEQAIINEIGWSGRFDIGLRDRAGIFDSNIGWNKVDPKIVRSVQYDVDLTDFENPKARLELSYENSSSGDENSCDRQSRPTREQNTHEFLGNGCYWNFIRAYVGTGTKLVGGDDLPVPSGAISVRSGKLLGGAPSLEYGVDDDGVRVSGLLVVPPGETGIVNWELELDPSVVEQSGESANYRVVLPSQAGIKSRSGLLTVTWPAGYAFVESSIEPLNLGIQSGEFIIDSRHDTELSLDLLRISN